MFCCWMLAVLRKGYTSIDWLWLYEAVRNVHVALYCTWYIQAWFIPFADAEQKDAISSTYYTTNDTDLQKNIHERNSTERNTKGLK